MLLPLRFIPCASTVSVNLSLLHLPNKTAMMRILVREVR